MIYDLSRHGFWFCIFYVNSTIHEFTPTVWTLIPLRQLLISPRDKIAIAAPVQIIYCSLLCFINFIPGWNQQLDLPWQLVQNLLNIWELVCWRRLPRQFQLIALGASIHNCYACSLPQNSCYWAHITKHGYLSSTQPHNVPWIEVEEDMGWPKTAQEEKVRVAQDHNGNWPTAARFLSGCWLTEFPKQPSRPPPSCCHFCQPPSSLPHSSQVSIPLFWRHVTNDD